MSHCGAQTQNFCVSVSVIPFWDLDSELVDVLVSLPSQDSDSEWRYQLPSPVVGHSKISGFLFEGWVVQVIVIHSGFCFVLICFVIFSSKVLDFQMRFDFLKQSMLKHFCT